MLTRNARKFSFPNLEFCVLTCTRRFTVIENATRYVFAKKEIEEIDTIRPRLVDPEYFQELKRTREDWHEMNIELERSFWQ